MNKKIYTGIRFDPVTDEQKELLTALLADAGFDGFEETESGLSAFALSSAVNRDELNRIATLTGLGFKEWAIEEKNWNEEWESSFEPVIIPGKVAVRASFHKSVSGVKQEIIITPKMSFGTGHHATTWLMMDSMFGFEFHNKSVLDFGTGTGILAILAEKLGSGNILAIDNDDWSIQNTGENIAANACQYITLQKMDAPPEHKKFDFILANINKGVILENREKLVKALSETGVLILSGLLTSDQADIENAFNPITGKPLFISEKNNWISLTFQIKEGPINSLLMT